MAEYPESGLSRGALLQLALGNVRQIHQYPAVPAMRVRVGRHVAVEAVLRSPLRGDLQREALAAQQFQIPVNGAQADAGQALPDDGVDLLGGGMRAERHEFLEDDSSLGSHPEGF